MIKAALQAIWECAQAFFIIVGAVAFIAGLIGLALWIIVTMVGM